MFVLGTSLDIPAGGSWAKPSTGKTEEGDYGFLFPNSSLFWVCSFQVC
jgi:hypothetical protein